MKQVRLDEIGYWSEVKLDIIKQYATAYSTIMAKQPTIRGHIYIDGFSGAGVHLSKETGEEIPGSPVNAMEVVPPFTEHHFVDLHSGKVDLLRKRCEDQTNVQIYEGDCNKVLIEQVFPRARYSDYKRALCLLDPYGLHLSWEVIKTAGQMKSIEIFLNFPVMDINMNILWHNPDKVSPDQAKRMSSFWGDDSWRQAAYREQPGLFGPVEEKTGNETMAEAFRQRLKEVAGFKFVPEPIPMRNTKGGIVYYLFFASPNEIGGKIVKAIFDKYRNTGI
jgi:three-Cys-motif partner protein